MLASFSAYLLANAISAYLKNNLLDTAWIVVVSVEIPHLHFLVPGRSWLWGHERRTREPTQGQSRCQWPFDPWVRHINEQMFHKYKTILLKNCSLGCLSSSQRAKSRKNFTSSTFPYFHYQNLWQWPHTTNTLESLWSTSINQPHKDRLMLNQLAACQNDTLTTCITCGGPRCDPFTTLNTSPPNLPIQWSSSERRWGRYPSRHTFTPKEQKDMMDRKTPQRCCRIVEVSPMVPTQKGMFPCFPSSEWVFQQIRVNLTSWKWCSDVQTCSSAPVKLVSLWNQANFVLSKKI